MKNFVIDDGSVNGGIRIYGMPDDVEVVNIKNEWYLMKGKVMEPIEIIYLLVL